MIFNDFAINARLHLDGNCDCGEQLREISLPQLVGTCFFCINCDKIYELKLAEIPKKLIGKKLLKLARYKASKS